MSAVPEATPIGDLQRLVGGTIDSDAALLLCSALAAEIRRELGIPEGTDGERVILLRAVITEVVIDARAEALVQVAGPKRGFVICAAGELLRVPDEIDHFERLKRRRGITEARWAELQRSMGPKMRCQLRAGLWLGERAKRDYSHRAAANREQELLGALLAAILTYASRNREKLLQELNIASRSAGGTDEASYKEGTASPGIPADSTMPAWYVPRPNLEARFTELVNRGARLIAFVSQAGMGKTEAARALTDDSSSQYPTPVIRFVNGQLSTEDLQAALQYSEISTESVSLANPRECLVKLVSSQSAPRFVVLDNFDTTDQVVELLPYHTESIVVATCRVVGRASSSRLQIINVPEMTTTEAVEMAVRLAPGLSRADAGEVAELLGNYPLAIRYACGRITSAHASVKNLCEDLRQEPHDITTESGRFETLGAILARTVAEIRDEEPIAHELLTLITARGSIRRPAISLRSYVAARLSKKRVELAYARAMDVLIRYCLVAIEPMTYMDALGSPSSLSRSDEVDISRDYFVSVHPLASVALSDSLREHLPVVRDVAALALMNFDRGIDWQQIGEVSMKGLARMLAISKCLYSAWDAVSCAGDHDGAHDNSDEHIAHVLVSHREFEEKWRDEIVGRFKSNPLFIERGFGYIVDMRD